MNHKPLFVLLVTIFVMAILFDIANALLGILEIRPEQSPQRQDTVKLWYIKAIAFAMFYMAITG